MRLPTVGVYSPSDRLAPHVRYADQAVALDADHPTESYLRIDKLIDAARRTGADTVHPGYGFLAENAEFARACRDAGLRFVGPTADVIALMGGKTASRQAAQQAGVPVVPGTESPLADELSDTEVNAVADQIGYPLFVKAVAGGGGKGMRLVHDPVDLFGAVRSARSEAKSAFGNSEVCLERCVAVARHIEIQLLADEHGSVVPFVERECSIQRRHQKVIEETPSSVVNADTRQALAAAAAALAKGVAYTGAGTVEFLLDDDGQFYFLEMNTRLQVEHPITEMVTGVDLVRWQLRIAAGERLTLGCRGDARAQGPCHRVSDLRGGSGGGLYPFTGTNHEPACGGRTGDTRRQRSRYGVRRADALRLDDLKVGRVGHRPRAGHRPHGACADRVRGVRGQDNDTVLPVDAPAPRLCRRSFRHPFSGSAAGGG